ncbi:MAG TPA: molybdopterin-dependent oxidoreductase [Solirubrobacteraceae bacterium]|nr:molybdopterin-dependent oxidoreductase [Solirubrobacteraceae bacterium]
MLLPGVDPAKPPPGPFRAGFWRSPLRGPWLTAVLGLVLLIGLPIVIITGLLSNDAYQPGLFGNALGRKLGPLDFYLFGWPTSPSWLYAFTQGLHVTVGLALFPVILAKLWSVIPRLFEWPPVRSPAHALERLSLAMLVGGALFEFATGIINIQYWYAFPFSFVQAHYYGAWVFIAGFIAHVSLKFGTMRRSLRMREEVLASPPGGLDLPDEPSLVATSPGPETMSRRVLLGTVGAGSLLLLLQGAGQSIGGPLRSLAFLLPRGQVRPGPLGFPVNKTAVAAGITAPRVGSTWRLQLVGSRSVSLSREQLLAMPQHTYELAIECVEGWSTTQRWSGVRLRDLATVCGVRGPARVYTASLDPGSYGHATLGHEQVADDHSLLALRVNGLDLNLDHGYPARVISPGVPGVHCTKWVTNMKFTRV